MAKQKKTTQSRTSASRQAFDFENRPYFVLVAFAVIVIALTILFSDFIFSDKMLFGSDTIQAGIFFRAFQVDYVHQHGTIPQWDPYIFGGMPYVDAFHGDIFYPLSILKYFGSLYRTLGWNLIIHIFLAGVFMYFAARRFLTSKTAAVLSAVCYMFAAYLVSFVAPGHDGKIFVTALFPLTILFLDRGFDAKNFFERLFNFSVLGLVIGVIILSPHAQMSYFTLWACALYSVYKLFVIFRESKSVTRLLQPGVLAMYGVVIGLLISAIQFYPGYIYTTEFSPRADSKRGWEWATSWSMHEEEAFSLLIPEFAGANTQRGESTYWGKNYFKDNSESVGTVTFFLALLGLFLYRRKESYFFGGLALFALIYALGATTPIFKLFFWLIPNVKSLRAPSMIMFMFSFSAALLAGMGVQAIIDENKDRKHSLSPKLNYLLFGFPALMLLFAVLFNVAGRGMLSTWTWFFYPGASMPISRQQTITYFDLALRNLPAIQSGAWWAFVFSAAAAVAIWLYRSGKLGQGVLAALILLPMVDGIRFNSRFVYAYDAQREWSPNAVSQFFTNTAGHYRVMNFASNVIKEDYLPHFGVEMVVGYHGNQLRWYDQLLGGPAKRNQGNQRFLNLVGAKYIVVPGEMEVPETYKTVSVAVDSRVVKIVENDAALPRVFLANQYRVFDSLEALQAEVLGGTDDMRQIVYLEQEPSLEILPDTARTDGAWITTYENDSIVVTVNATTNHILVLTDNYYDSWHAFVDGQPTELLRSYGTFRAVEIPAGSREVTFKYSSDRYRLGKLATGLTTVWVLIIIAGHYSAGWLRRKNRKDS